MPDNSVLLDPVALFDARTEATRQGYPPLDDRILLAYGRRIAALADERARADERERIARAIEVARGDRCPECGGKAAFRRVDGAKVGHGCGGGHVWQHPDRPWLDYDPVEIARRGGA